MTARERRLVAPPQLPGDEQQLLQPLEPLGQGRELRRLRALGGAGTATCAGVHEEQSRTGSLPVGERSSASARG